MRNGSYIVLDDTRRYPAIASTPVCVVTYQPVGGDLHIKYLIGARGETFQLPDEHPDFVDAAATGRVIIPRDDGLLVLEWATVGSWRTAELEHEIAVDWSVTDMATDAEVQRRVGMLCGDME